MPADPTTPAPGGHWLEEVLDDVRVFRATRDRTPPATCQGADFSRALEHLGDNLQAHAERDYPGMPLLQAVYVARGGHAPGSRCPSAPDAEPEHVLECEWPDDECACHLYGVRHG